MPHRRLHGTELETMLTTARPREFRENVGARHYGVVADSSRGTGGRTLILPIFRHVGSITAVLIQAYRPTNEKVPNKKGSLFGRSESCPKEIYQVGNY